MTIHDAPHVTLTPVELAALANPPLDPMGRFSLICGFVVVALTVIVACSL